MPRGLSITFWLSDSSKNPNNIHRIKHSFWVSKASDWLIQFLSRHIHTSSALMTPGIAQNPSQDHTTYQATASADCCCPTAGAGLPRCAKEVARNPWVGWNLCSGVVAASPFYYVVMGKKSHVDSQVKKQIFLLVINFVIYHIFTFSEMSLLPQTWDGMV